MSIPALLYNDEWDREHGYPISSIQVDALEAIAKEYGLSLASPPWYYFATIHGSIIQGKMTYTRLNGSSRFCPEDLTFLASLPNVRWVELKEGLLIVGLPHSPKPKAS